MRHFKRFLRSHRTILALVLTLCFGATLSSLLWYQHHHAQPTQAAMEWDRYLMEADNIVVGNFDFATLNANDQMVAFVDRLTGDVLFQRSDDGGQTWDRTTIEAGTGEVNETRAGLIDIDIVDTNTIFVVFASEDRATLRFAASTDGGDTWNVSEYDGTGVDLFGGVSLDAFDANNVALAYNKNVGPDNILLVVSSDGGDTFAAPVLVSAVDQDNIFNVQMVSATDIFVLYNSDDGGGYDAFVAVSTDGGASIDFSTEVAAVVDGGFAISAVDANTVSLCYFDSVNEYPTYAYSTNGAASFSIETINATASTIFNCSIDMISATEAVVSYQNDTDAHVVSVLTNSGTTVNTTEPLSGDDIGAANFLIVNALTTDDVFVSGPEFNGAVFASTDDSGIVWLPFAAAGQRPLFAATVWPSFDYFYHAYFDDIGNDFRVLRYYDPTVTWTNSFVDGNSSGIEAGAFVQGSAPDEDNVFFIYNSDENFPSQEAKVAYTSDHGDTWNTSIVNPGGNMISDSLAIHSLDGTLVDVLLYDSSVDELQYYASTDGGLNWNYVTSIEAGNLVDVRQTNIHRIDNDVLYAGYYDGNDGTVWFSYSSDNGANWDISQVISTTPHADTELEMVVVDVDVVYVAVFDADVEELVLYRSGDGGGDFEGLSIDPQHAGPFLDLAVEGETVVASWIDGDTQQLHYAISNDGGIEYAYRAIPDYPNGLDYHVRPQIALQGADILRTSYQTTGDLDSLLMANSYLGNIDDWIYTNVDDNGNDVGANSDMVAVNTNTLFASYYDNTNFEFRVARSADGGVNWNSSYFDSSANATSIDAPTATDVFIAYNYVGGGPFDDLWVVKSIDGGENPDTYTEVNPGFAGDVGGAISLDAFDTDNVFVAYTNVNSGELWIGYSTDGANSFTNVMVDSDGQVGSHDSLQALDANNLYIVYANQFGQLRFASSSNGGASWSTDFIDSNANGYTTANAIEVIDANTIHVVYGNGTDSYFATSTDGGANWDTELNFNNTQYEVADYLSIDATDEDHLYISGFSDATTKLYLFSSPDAGNTWHAFDLEESGAGWYSQVQAATDTHIFVSGYSQPQGLFRVYRSAEPALSSPVLIRPQDGAVVTNDTVVLSVQYTDVATPGTTDYRISTSSTADCVNDVNTFDSAISAITVTNDQPTSVQIDGLTHGNTYYWCARNDNGTDVTPWTEMGEFTTNLLLPIGPTYATFLGGSLGDIANSVAVESGAIYVGGGSYSTDFPVTTGAYDETHNGDRDAFVAKLSPDGAGSLDLVYATFVGGAQDDVFGWQGDALGSEIAVASGQAYLATSTFSTDFPTTAGAFDTTKGGGTGTADAAFFQLSATGDDLLYSTYLGGSGADGDYQDGIEVSAGLVYIGGTTLSADFPTTTGSYSDTQINATDAFVVVLDPSGNGAADLQYGTYFGGSNGPTDGVDIDFDNGMVYLVGYTQATNLPTTAPVGTPFQTSHAGGISDGYAAIIDPSSNGSSDLVYSTYLGGSDDEDTPFDVVVDSDLLYIAGQALSTDFPVTTGAYNENHSGGYDGYFLILDPSGNGAADLQYSTFFGGSTDDYLFGIDLLASGNIIVAGQSDSADLPTTSLETLGDAGGFVATFDAVGNGTDDLLSSELLQGGGFDGVWALAYDGVSVYLAGATDSQDFPAFAIGGDPYDLTQNGGTDAFIAVYNPASAVGPGSIAPSDPTLVYPDDGTYRAGVTILAATYEHASLPGTTDYRVATGSAANCLNGVNLQASGTSAVTSTDTETTFFEVDELSVGTKYWCARNDNGTTQTAWVTMGTYIQDTGVPYLNYSTVLGGSGSDSVSTISIYNGDVYLLGSTDSVDFPDTVGAYDTTNDGGTATFIAAISTDGAGAADWQFATYFEATGGLSPNDIFADATGVYVVGQTNSTSLPTAGGTGGTPYDGTHNHGGSTADPFIARFSTDGSDLEYATYFGGTFFDDADLVMVEAGLTYVIGSSTSSFPTTAGAYDTTYAGGSELYVAVFDLAGNGASDLLYSSYFGLTGDEVALTMDVQDGIVYFGGYTSSSYPTTAGAFDTTKVGFGTESTLTVFNPAGGGASDLIYSTLLGGTDQETMNAIAFDDSDDTIVGCMGVRSDDIPTTAGAYASTGDGFGDSYIFRLNPAGTGASDLVYGSYFEDGGGCRDGATLYDGDFYMSMSPENADMVVTANAYASAQAEGAIVRFNLGGNGADDLVYSSFMPGEGEMAMDGQLLYVGGATQDATYPTFADPGTPYDTTFAGFEDGFVFRVDFTENPYLPTLIFPDDGAARAGEVTLSATYQHPSLPGEVFYRVSSTSLGACVTNTAIVASGSDVTSTNNEATTFSLPSILTDGTYYWCTMADDGTLQTSWAPMGEWEQDSTVPYLNYATYLGGGDVDSLAEIDLDGSTIYFIGTTNSIDFSATIGAYDTSHNGNNDIFVGAMDFDGTGASDMLFMTFIGSTAVDNAYSVAFEGGKIYGTGQTLSASIPTTGGAYDTTLSGVSDAYAFRLSADGSALEYGTLLGGSSGEDTLRIAGVSSGVMYIEGTVNASGYPTTAGAYDTTYNGFAGNRDMVFTALNPAGTGAGDLVYSTYLGSTGDDFYQAELVNGKFYFSGYSIGVFPVTAGAYDTSHNGGQDAAFGILNPAGAGASDLEYSSYFGGTSNEFLLCRDVDPATGNIYVGGYTASSDLPTTAGAYDTSFSSGVNVFLARLNPINGAGALEYSTYISTSEVSVCRFMIFDGTDVFFTGQASEADFPITAASAYGNDNSTGTRLTLMQFNLGANGVDDLVYSTYLSYPAPGSPFPAGIAKDGDDLYFGMVLATNGSIEPIADPGSPFNSIYNGGSSDSALMRIDFSGVVPPAPPAGGGSSIQRLEELRTIARPVIGPATVLGPDSIRFEWTYGEVSNINGFRLINDVNAIAVQVPFATAVAATETGLPHNTVISGRKVTAYNDSGESLPSATYADEYTHMVVPQPALISREGNSILVESETDLNNLQAGLSGIQFELIPADTVAGAQTITSDWIQTEAYTFTGAQEGVAYLLRSRARNQIAFETNWSSTILIPAEDVVPGTAQLSVGLTITASDGQSLVEALNPNSIMYGEITVNNTGDGDAENVLLTLPIPDYISYIPGTLSVGGRKQSDGADGDFGQNGSGVVSVIWPELEAGLGQSVRFQLGFDTQRLVEDFVKPLLDEARIESRLVPTESLAEINRVLAQAVAAANPEIVMQAQASHQDDPTPVFSNEQHVQPDISIIEPVVIEAPEPEEEPVIVTDPVAPTPEQVEIIENILETEFPQPGQPAPAQPIPQGETTSSFDGGSFGIQTSSGDNTLTLSGFAQTNEDQIEFTGTTSEPFTVVTLIFNESVTAIAVSDINGNWRTFVSAEELGIAEGEEQQVTIEAIAAKGDLRSERVQIADITVTRGMRGQIVADFETVVSEQGFISTLQRTAETVTETLQENEPEIQTTLVVSAPVIVASSVPLWGYLPYVPTLIYHFIAWLFGIVNRKKKDEEHPTFGVVYDAITKLPLPLAIVRIYNSTDNKLAGTIVTDKLGRYDTLLAPGQYRFEVAKPQYQFPSAIVTTAVDGSFDRIYHANTGVTVAQGSLALPHIPVDPINVQRQWELSFGVRKAWLAFQRLGNHLATPIMLVGFITALGLVYATPDRPANWVMAGVYALTLASQLKLKPKLIKAWGVVYDLTSNAILPLVTIQLIEPATSKVVTSRLSDYDGRFTFLPEPGTYVVKASKPGFTQVTDSQAISNMQAKDRAPLTDSITISKPNQRVSGDVAMKQGA